MFISQVIANTSKNTADAMMANLAFQNIMEVINLKKQVADKRKNESKAKVVKPVVTKTNRPKPRYSEPIIDVKATPVNDTKNNESKTEVNKETTKIVEPKITNTEPKKTEKSAFNPTVNNPIDYPRVYAVVPELRNYRNTDNRKIVITRLLDSMPVPSGKDYDAVLSQFEANLSKYNVMDLVSNINYNPLATNANGDVVCANANLEKAHPWAKYNNFFMIAFDTVFMNEITVRAKMIEDMFTTNQIPHTNHMVMECAKAQIHSEMVAANNGVTIDSFNNFNYAEFIKSYNKIYGTNSKPNMKKGGNGLGESNKNLRKEQESIKEHPAMKNLLASHEQEVEQFFNQVQQEAQQYVYSLKSQLDQIGQMYSVNSIQYQQAELNMNNLIKQKDIESHTKYDQILARQQSEVENLAHQIKSGVYGQQQSGFNYDAEEQIIVYPQQNFCQPSFARPRSIEDFIPINTTCTRTSMFRMRDPRDAILESKGIITATSGTIEGEAPIVTKVLRNALADDDKDPFDKGANQFADLAPESEIKKYEAIANETDNGSDSVGMTNMDSLFSDNQGTNLDVDYDLLSKTEISADDNIFNKESYNVITPQEIASQPIQQSFAFMNRYFVPQVPFDVFYRRGYDDDAKRMIMNASNPPAGSIDPLSITGRMMTPIKCYNPRYPLITDVNGNDLSYKGFKVDFQQEEWLRKIAEEQKSIYLANQGRFPYTNQPEYIFDNIEIIDGTGMNLDELTEVYHNQTANEVIYFNYEGKFGKKYPMFDYYMIHPTFEAQLRILNALLAVEDPYSYYDWHGVRRPLPQTIEEYFKAYLTYGMRVPQEPFDMIIAQYPEEGYDQLISPELRNFEVNFDYLCKNEKLGCWLEMNIKKWQSAIEYINTAAKFSINLFNHMADETPTEHKRKYYVAQARLAVAENALKNSIEMLNAYNEGNVDQDALPMIKSLIDFGVPNMDNAEIITRINQHDFSNFTILERAVRQQTEPDIDIHRLLGTEQFICNLHPYDVWYDMYKICDTFTSVYDKNQGAAFYIRVKMAFDASIQAKDYPRINTDYYNDYLHFADDESCFRVRSSIGEGFITHIIPLSFKKVEVQKPVEQVQYPKSSLGLDFLDPKKGFMGRPKMPPTLPMVHNTSIMGQYGAMLEPELQFNMNGFCTVLGTFRDSNGAYDTDSRWMHYKDPDELKKTNEKQEVFATLEEVPKEKEDTSIKKCIVRSTYDEEGNLVQDYYGDEEAIKYSEQKAEEEERKLEEEEERIEKLEGTRYRLYDELSRYNTNIAKSYLWLAHMENEQTMTEVMKCLAKYLDTCRMDDAFATYKAMYVMTDDGIKYMPARDCKDIEDLHKKANEYIAMVERRKPLKQQYATEDMYNHFMEVYNKGKDNAVKVANTILGYNDAEKAIQYLRSLTNCDVCLTPALEQTFFDGIMRKMNPADYYNYQQYCTMMMLMKADKRRDSNSRYELWFDGWWDKHGVPKEYKHRTLSQEENIVEQNRRAYRVMSNIRRLHLHALELNQKFLPKVKEDLYFRQRPMFNKLLKVTDKIPQEMGLYEFTHSMKGVGKIYDVFNNDAVHERNVKMKMGRSLYRGANFQVPNYQPQIASLGFETYYRDKNGVPIIHSPEEVAKGFDSPFNAEQYNKCRQAFADKIFTRVKMKCLGGTANHVQR